MVSLELLRRAQLGFCAGFADAEPRPYGMLYYNLAVPESHDSNHAYILDERADAASAITDVVRFYRERGLTPRIYSALIPGQLARLRPALLAQGFTISEHTDPVLRWYVQARPSVIVPNPELVVRRVTEMDDEVAAFVSEEGEFPWTVKLFRRHLLSPLYHQLIGYLGERPVAMASFTTLEGISRVDDVVTREAYRGRGFARTVMHTLVARHAEASDNPLILGVTDRVAERVYQDAGFVRRPVEDNYWTASLGEQSDG